MYNLKYIKKMNWDPLWNYKPDHSLIIGSYHNQKKLRNKIKRWTQTYLTDQSTYGKFWSERRNREANPVRLTHEPFSYWGLLPGQRRRSHIWSAGWGVEFPTWCSGDLLSFSPPLPLAVAGPEAGSVLFSTTRSGTKLPTPTYIKKNHPNQSQYILKIPWINSTIKGLEKCSN